MTTPVMTGSEAAEPVKRIRWTITPEEFFASNGPLRDIYGSGYSYRASQVEMAMTIFNLMHKPADKAYPVAIEAPTGSGKGLAYIAGCILAGGKLIIPTANKALQRQLITKDLPTFKLVADLYGIPFSAVQVMGKTNYACMLRIGEEKPAISSDLYDWVFAVDEQGKPVNSGNQYDLPPELSWAADDWYKISADDGCLGSKCHLAEQCGYVRVKQAAKKADVIVTNQHLMAIDLVAHFPGICIPNGFNKTYQNGQLVGTSPVLVCVDEAHEWPDIVSGQTSVELHRSIFSKYDSDVQYYADRFFAQFEAHVPQSAYRKVDTKMGQVWAVDPNFQMRFDNATIDHANEFAGQLHIWANETWPADRKPANMGEQKAASAAQRARKHADTVYMLASEVPDGWVRILSIGDTKDQKDPTTDLAYRIQLELVQWDVSDVIRGMWSGARKPGIQPRGSKKLPKGAGQDMGDTAEPVDMAVGGEFIAEDENDPATGTTLAESAPGWRVVFTSATLRSLGDFDKFLNDTGFDGVADTSALPNVFDYRQNCRLYVPTDMPGDVHGEDFQHAAAARILELAEITNGRMFVLVTSYRKLEMIANELGRLCKGKKWTILRQDKQNSKLMVEAFTAVEGEHCILLGTATFWAGVDIPGEALSQVVICGLPFPVPDDPIFQARKDAIIKATGRDNSFGLLSLPATAFRLRQGFGRLIRRWNDRGVVTILDARLSDKPWGRKLAVDLPPALLVRDMRSVREFFGKFKAVSNAEELL